MRSDEELIRLLQRGDSEAFSEFVARHKDRVYRMAWLWLRAPQDAEDVLQEVLMRSYTGFSRFRFGASPLTWLLRVTRNVCHEFNRQPRPVSAAAWECTVESSVPDGQDYWSREQLRLHARQLVQALPRRQKEVVSLRILEELSTRDTAAIMGCREGTVKALLNRAMGQMKQQLDLEYQ